mgnify:FL=1
MNKLEIVVPCYNEEEILDYTINELQILLEIMVEDKLVSPLSGVCFINTIWQLTKSSRYYNMQKWSL